MKRVIVVSIMIVLIIVGIEKVVEFMIQNIDIKKRNTGLEFKMREIR